jgi:hypothetical protein
MEASPGNDGGRPEGRDHWSWRRPASNLRSSARSATDDRVRVVIDVARRAFGGGRRALSRRGD